jgi:surfactin synthase thioesterase subunit
MNLFCFPFAGGGKHSYRSFAEKAPSFINVIPLDLPGRGSRVMEPLLTSLYDMADDIWQQIKNELHRPYALYGHSMGTLLVYLITHRAIREGYPLPVHLFLTGSRAPSVRKEGGNVHALPRDAFTLKVREMGGMTDEVLQNETLMTFFEPILRADFQAVESFRYTQLPPFNIAITAITGTEEKATDEEVKAWEKETTAPVEVWRMTGKHFFIFNFEQEIMEHIGERLGKHLAIS